ncbi:hypothetical protein VTN02DRAFT_4620 [Thermoascus thermophilus]
MVERVAAPDEDSRKAKKGGDSSSPGADSRPQERQIKVKSQSSDSSGCQTVDEKIAHILEVYAKAKDDYYNQDYTNIAKKLNAARFLRDTAENTLNYIRAHGMGEHSMVLELKDTFETMKEKATILSGGRKRRFEITEADKRFPPTPVKRPFERFPGPANRRPDYYRP